MYKINAQGESDYDAERHVLDCKDYTEMAVMLLDADWVQILQMLNSNLTKNLFIKVSKITLPNTGVPQYQEATQTFPK